MIVLVALAGGIGAVLRFVVESMTSSVRAAVPLGTFVVNVTGSFLLGLLVATTGADSDLRAVVGTGLLGGYTTFSAASLEAVLLARVGGPRALSLATMHAAAMLACALGAAALGLWLGDGFPG